MTNDIAIDYINPISKEDSLLDSSVKVTGEYQEIREGGQKVHQGVDYGVSIGTSVYAAANGIIIKAGNTDGYGNYIIIKHSNGESTLYAHLNELDVSYGQAVFQGQEIAKSGNSGIGTGPHLHFEVINSIGTNGIESSGNSQNTGIKGSLYRENPASRDLASTPNTDSAKESLANTINQGTNQTEKEQNAKNWFSAFSDSLELWTDSAINFITDSATYIGQYLSSPSQAIDKINDWVGDTYTIHKGDTLSKIASLYGLTTEQLVASNPWLETDGRISSDGKYALIKPGETLTIPEASSLDQNSDYFQHLQSDLVSLNTSEKSQLSDVFDLLNPANAQIFATVLKSSLNGFIADTHTIGTFIQSYLNSLSSAEKANTGGWDPLTLDLNGDGVQLTNINNSSVFFDLDVTANLDSDGNFDGTYTSDGVKEQVGWVSANDGLLVLDKNSNGTILAWGFDTFFDRIY